VTAVIQEVVRVDLDVEAIRVVIRCGGYVVLPCSNLNAELLEGLQKSLAPLGIRVMRLSTWRLDDGSPLCGKERLRFEAQP
jgi:hypothetical protein